MKTDEELEISEHWDRYYALPFREKIREDGVSGWLLHTNTGIVLTLVAVLGLLALIAPLLPR